MPDAPVTSWRMLFDPEVVSKFADCGIHVLDAPTELIPAALNYIGEDPNSKDPDVIAKAEPVLMAIRPYIQKFHSSEYINALANGDICLALGWSGDVLQARDRADEADNNVTIKYVAPDEGALMWFDQMAIPTDAPHKEEAHVFLNYIMEPEVMAKASNYVYFANGNKASQEFLEEDVIGDPCDLPDPGGAGDPLHGHALSAEGPAYGDPSLDQGENRSVSLDNGPAPDPVRGRSLLVTRIRI